MKSELEIQAAHDKLVAIITGDVPNPFYPYKKFAAETLEERIITEQCSVLCWLLGHDHNLTFGNNLNAIDKELSEMGYVLERLNN